MEKKEPKWNVLPIKGLEDGDFNKFTIQFLAKSENGIASRGRKVSEETKKLISQNGKGKTLGRKTSEETKKKIGESSKNRFFSEESRKKKSETIKKIRTIHFNEEAIKNRFEKNCKPILYYTYPEMKFICEFKSAKIASKELKRDRSGIIKILNGTIKEPRKFIFKYKN